MDLVFWMYNQLNEGTTIGMGGNKKNKAYRNLAHTKRTKETIVCIIKNWGEGLLVGSKKKNVPSDLSHSVVRVYDFYMAHDIY
jgi:hypothetical protein